MSFAFSSFSVFFIRISRLHRHSSFSWSRSVFFLRIQFSVVSLADLRLELFSQHLFMLPYSCVSPSRAVLMLFFLDYLHSDILHPAVPFLLAHVAYFTVLASGTLPEPSHSVLFQSGYPWFPKRQLKSFPRRLSSPLLFLLLNLFLSLLPYSVLYLSLSLSCVLRYFQSSCSLSVLLFAVFYRVSFFLAFLSGFRSVGYFSHAFAFAYVLSH